MATKKTPADIPAETSTAQRSDYDAAVAIDLIVPHPKNVRRHAVADDELVASIQAQGLLQPLVVTPAEDGAGYTLIAGHRRLDGLKKAGFTLAPVIIRHDLIDQADQVAAMLVENGRREDLTPMEEAEGYGQLRFDFGWKPGAIAKAAGHSVDTINRRLKLLKLDEKTKKSFDKGQMSIDDAVQLAELPKKDQTEVARHAGTSNFKWALGQAKDKIRARERAAAEIRRLEGMGIRRINKTERSNIHSFTHTADGVTPIGQTFSRQIEDHPGCIAFVVLHDYRGFDVAELVCTNNPAHDEQLDAARAAKRRAEDEEREAKERASESLRVARSLRIDAAIDAIKPGTRLEPALADLLRVLTHQLLLSMNDYGRYQAAFAYWTALGVEERDQWGLGVLWSDHDVDKFRTHCETYLDGSTANLLKAFTAATAAHVEIAAVARFGELAATKTLEPREALLTGIRWMQFLTDNGHQLNDVDEQILATANGSVHEPEPTRLVDVLAAQAAEQAS
jgi:ParB/RepB/Spo0J family partition protein